MAANENSALTDGGGYFFLSQALTASGVHMEGAQLVVAADGSCTDAYTGLALSISLTAQPGSTMITPLSQLIIALAASDSSMDLSTATLAFRSRLYLNQSGYQLSPIDLMSYDPYHAFNTGVSACLAGGLVVRNAQLQAFAEQLATIRSFATSAATLDSAVHSAPDFYQTLATTIAASNFGALGEYSTVAPMVAAQLGSSVATSKRVALANAMVRSYALLDEARPYCPVFEPWQADLATATNSNRSHHCAAPLEWNDALATSAQAYASTVCNGDLVGSPEALAADASFGENVARLSFDSSTSLVAVATHLFETWQNPAHAFPFDAMTGATGPCDDGMTFELTAAQAEARFPNTGLSWNSRIAEDISLICVPNSVANFGFYTNVLWKEFTQMGCGLASCGRASGGSEEYSLVCRYQKEGCTGPTCAGNTPGNFLQNVRPRVTPGNCEQVAWAPIVQLAQAQRVVQSASGSTSGLLPRKITQLLGGMINVTTFDAETDASTLSATAALQVVPAAYGPSSPPSTNAPPIAPLISDMADPLSEMVETDGGAIAAAVLLPLFTFCLCLSAIMLYRLSGGQPYAWLKLKASHENPNIHFMYVPRDKREQLKTEVVASKQAMDEAMKQHPNKRVAYMNMRKDHAAYKKRLVEEGYPAMDTTSSGSGALLSNAPAAESTPPVPAPVPVPVTSQPGIEAELDAEFDEPMEDRMRRFEWIRYYVRENDLQKAFDLGWDGKPFRLTSSAVLPQSIEPAPMNAPAAEPASKVRPAAVVSTVVPGGGVEGRVPAGVEPAADHPLSPPPDSEAALHRI